MTDSAIKRIQEHIDRYWIRSNAWPDFVEVMRLVFKSTRQEAIERGDEDPHRLAVLPGLCCQAAGGDPGWADGFAAAWLLFYTAAHLLDKIEDQDPPEAWWEELGSGAVLNVATSYCFCASQILNRLYRVKEIEESVEEIIDGIYDQLLVMCSGQHHDLIHSEPNLAQYWEITGAKSGAFFALACRSGARLAMDDEIKLAGYEQYGYHFGILLQLLDDLGDFENAENFPEGGLSPGVSRSLMVAYALEHLPEDEGNRLRNYLYRESESTEYIINLIDQSGAGFYLSLEFERHRKAAIQAIDQADPSHPMRDRLVSLLPNL